ncbi:MAG TPA: GNAT family N-acetyltransferase [Nocardioidaceae bacterium]|nr:GNAT family N-acetyltransferase [Nocardioidaceae bacterium]
MRRGFPPRDERIRARTDHDVDAGVDILRRVHLTHGYPVNWPDDPSGWLRGGTESAWVATTPVSCVGHVAVAVDAGIAFVERLFVEPGREGAGIGRALLRHATAEGRELAGDVMLDVIAADDAANRLYRAEGWTEVSRTSIAWGRSPDSAVIRFRAP